jgi:hypothetical protein
MDVPFPINRNSMLVSHSKKFIFIHNYKVAGNSVNDALSKYTSDGRNLNPIEKLGKRAGILPKHYPYLFPWHLTASQVRDKMKGSGIFESYYKFGFVRNPWDWQVSLYTFMLKTTSHAQHRFIKKMKNFEEYIDWRINRDLHLQRDAFYDDDVCLMDFIGKIEKIDRDFAVICRHLGIEEQIPHKNRSRANNDFSPYYTQKSIDAIYEAYYQDIITFGYDKPVLDDTSPISQRDSYVNTALTERQ